MAAGGTGLQKALSPGFPWHQESWKRRFHLAAVGGHLVLRGDRNFYLVSNLCPRVGDRVRRQFKHGFGVHANRRYAPGLHMFFNVGDDVFGVQIDNVDGVAHCNGVNAMRGDNPKRLSIVKLVARSPEKALHPGPM